MSSIFRSPGAGNCEKIMYVIASGLPRNRNIAKLRIHAAAHHTTMDYVRWTTRSSAFERSSLSDDDNEDYDDDDNALRIRVLSKRRC